MGIEAVAVNEPRSDRPRPDADLRTTPALIVAAIRDAGTQFADLLRLARIEVRGNLRAVATLAVLFGGALLLVLVSLVLLLIALRDAIAVLTGSDILAGAIVALPFLSATAILLRLGFRRMGLRSVGA
ncbi:Putative Holin-X, holin superfamily III [Methylorubrum salsuginis]|uniref:Putative Holin-X, holin superfamily III n=1 Tax=Methylorubrum salsuginis TaxID=414703 RepID=A0A1I4C491_9HYPH|nr:Putative Holin-X, holin superfamily III [Methylorubrum salsuginis]